MSFLFPRPTVDTNPRTVVVHEAIPNEDDTGWRTAGLTRRDLDGAVLERAMELSVWLYRRNPLASRIVKIHTAYMAGTGFGVEAANPDVAAVVDEFWHAPRNRLDRHHRGFARDFILFGEGHHPLAADDTGNVTVGVIDPINVEAVNRNTMNNLIIDSIRLKRNVVGGDPTNIPVLRADADPFSETAGLLVGDVATWLYDRIGAASRGVPYLLPSLDWLDAYDQVLWELLERTKATRAYFWDVMVTGDATDVDKAKAVWGTTPPRSGSVRFRTDAMAVTATQPSIGAYEDANTARLILRHISAGAGVAPHWLGDPEDANRSTAESMDQPVLMSIQDLQTLWRSNMLELVQAAVDRKVAAGMLPRTVERYNDRGQPTGEQIPARDAVDIVVPAITDDDVVAAAGALAQVALAIQALEATTVGPIVDLNVARRIVRQFLPALGVPADELPDPDDDNTDRDAQALESLLRQAARGKLDALLDEIARVDQVA